MLKALMAVTILILIGPVLLTIWISFTPEPGLSMAFIVPSFRWYHQLSENREFILSFQQSVIVAVGSTVTSVSAGTLAAYAINRFRFRGRDFVNTMLLSPLMIPGVAIGIGLGQFLAKLHIGYGYVSLLIGHTIIAMPYVTRTVSASLVGVDRNIELAARNLGASIMRTFWLVALPLIRPGLLAGGLLAFVTSFDELTVSLFLSGVRVTPLPVQIYAYIQTVLDPTVAALATILVLLSIGTILLLEWLLGLDHVLGFSDKRGVKEPAIVG